MNPFNTLLPPLTQVAFLVAVGVLCRLEGILSNRGTDEITKLILNITLPIMLFVSGAQSDVVELVRQGPLVFLAGVVCPLLGFSIGAVVAWLFKLPPRQAVVVRVGASLSNTAFIGIPVCTALWGSQGALLAAVYDLGITFPLLLLAPLAYGKPANGNLWKQLLLAPMMWGLMLGILWNLMGFGLTPWLMIPLSAIGNVTLPLSLVTIGALAIPDKIEANSLRALIAFLSSRLLVAPIIIWALAFALGWRGIGAAVSILQTAMPASVTATVMAREYGAEANLAASGAMFSVLFSLATIPLFSRLVLGIG